MKILCDVCGKEEASAFCCADEAALCDACDRRVHWANNLAGRHRRFSLSAQSHPPCDICQERRGFFFCQEDRAILCRDCDASVHSANHLTMKHNRFLLTGVRLSAAPISSFPPPKKEPSAKTDTNVTVPILSNENKALVTDGPSPIASTSASATTATISSAAATTATSSISDYLIKMCPGWRVEDLLVDDEDAALEGLSKSKGGELLPFWEADVDNGGLAAVAAEFPVGAPHVPQFAPPGIRGGGGAHYQPWNESREVGRERWSEDAFMVPQISPASTPSKRPRHSLW